MKARVHRKARWGSGSVAARGARSRGSGCGAAATIRRAGAHRGIPARSAAIRLNQLQHQEQHTGIDRATRFAWIFSTAVCGLSLPVIAQTTDTPYGTAKFAAYSDIDEIKQLKVVWDLNFTDPKAVGIVLNFVNALMIATSEFGPHEIDPVKIVIVSHGPELVVFAKNNYGKYKDIVDRAASFAKQGIRFETCRNAARFLGFTAEDLHGFVTLAPPAPYSLAYWQVKGYTLNAVGATMPTTPMSELNKNDINR